MEDDPAWIAILAAALEHGGFLGISLPPGADPADLARDPGFDALLISSGGADFAARLRALRAGLDVPIAVLAQGSSETERIEALDGGADQVFTRPIMPGELVARLRALLRRAAPQGNDLRLVLDPCARKVGYAGKSAALTPSEFGILECLLLNRDVVTGRSEILARLEGPGRRPEPASLEALISKLRRKLRQLGYPEALVGVRGQGWVFRTPAAPG